MRVCLTDNKRKYSHAGLLLKLRTTKCVSRKDVEQILPLLYQSPLRFLVRITNGYPGFEKSRKRTEY